QEDEAAPLGDPDRMEREVFAGERRILIEEGRAEEAAVERVRPRVIRAAKRRPLRIGGAEARPPVAEHVDVGLQPADCRARDEEALAEDLEDAYAARLRQDLRAARAEPLAGEDPLPLAREDLGRAVVLGGQ